MNPLKFPIIGTVILFTIAGLLAFYIPLPPSTASSDVTSKLLQR